MRGKQRTRREIDSSGHRESALNMKSSKLDCVWSKIGCFGRRNEPKKVDDEQKLVNKQINDTIQRDKQEYRSTHRLLLLGAGSSGKTTILQNVEILNAVDLTEAQKLQRVLDIKKSLRDAIVSVASSMINLKPPIELQYIENEPHLDYMLTESVSFCQDEQFTDVFFDRLQALWSDEGIRKCYNLINEVKAIDTIGTSYFLGKVESIRDKNYRPTDQDLMQCCLVRSGVSEVKVSIAGVKFHIFDVNYQKDERMKWINCFNDITAILFVADSSGYDIFSEEHPTVNRLQEAIDFFCRIWNNRWLRTVSIILFLNKKDLLEEKLLTGKSRLEDNFSEFECYCVPSDSCYTSGSDDPEVTRAKYFIRDLFLRLCQSCEDRRYCYPHFTCGTDTENIQRLFSDCRDIIQRMHLRQYELL